MRAPVPAQALLSASMGAHFCKIKCWAAKSGHISKWLTCYVNDFPYTCTAGRESSASLLKMCRTKHSSSLLKMCRTMCVKLGFEYSKGVRRFDTGFFFFRSVHIPFGPLCKNKTARVQLS